MTTISARGANGRRGTFRPCRSGFESPRADQLPQRGGTAYAAVSNTAERNRLKTGAHVGATPTAGTNRSTVGEGKRCRSLTPNSRDVEKPGYSPRRRKPASAGSNPAVPTMALWCNGSTTDSGPVSLRSNRSGAAIPDVV